MINNILILMIWILLMANIVDFFILNPEQYYALKEQLLLTWEALWK